MTSPIIYSAQKDEGECLPGCTHFRKCTYHDPNKCGLAIPCLCNGTGKRCIAGDLNIPFEECPYDHGCPEGCKYNATCLSCNGKGWWLVDSIMTQNGEENEVRE